MERDRLVHELLQIRESRALKLNHLEHEIITEAMCALSSPCACGGKTPLAVVEAEATIAAFSKTPWASAIGSIQISPEPVEGLGDGDKLTLIVLPGGKPCGFCRGLGYIVNPDDLKQVWCYCRDPRPIWSEEEMRHALPGGKP